MKMRARATASFAVLGCLLAIAGCAGDSDDSVSVADYKAQANEICDETVSAWTARLTKETAAHPDASSLPEEKRTEIAATKILLPPLERMVSSFSELETPEKGAQQVEGAVADFEAVLAEGRQDHAALASGAALVEAREKAAAAGLTACGV